MTRKLLPALLLLALAAPAAHAGNLTAGAGRADITPPTGYFTFGYVRADSKIAGQSTRLFARVLVLERDGKKVALVSEDLGGIPGGMMADAANMVKDRGFSEQNVLDSASHTHSGPAGYFNFGTYNTVFPSKATLTGLTTTFDFSVEADQQLYTFMVKRLAEAIKRADEDRAPALAAWGATRITGLTANRSIEAHLADFGIIKAYGEGDPSMDPGGPDNTVDANVHVLRVDKIAPKSKAKAKKKKKRRAKRSAKRKKKRTKKKAAAKTVPLGAWSTFADHGTVVKYDFGAFSADHHGSATRVFEDEVRRQGGVPDGQEIVNVYGNADEGDMSAGLTRSGPAEADYVGRVEAAAMLEAWRGAGKHLSATPQLDLRWTRICYCGQQTEGGKVDTTSVIGLPQFTGSEEGRGPLYDETQTLFEDRRAAVDDPVQGYKIPVVRDEQGGTPTAVPLLAIRVANGMIVSVPGEMTVEMGNRVRDAVTKATAGAGINLVAISGLANEYINYFATPEEYQRQHYEGGATIYGRWSSNVIKVGLTDLAGRLASGQPAPEPYAFDPGGSLEATAAPYPTGGSSGSVLQQPGPVQRLQRARFAWSGGPRGEDRPLDSAFVTIERRTTRGWEKEADDLGLQILWKVDEQSRYTAQWEVPRDAYEGEYRFVITANNYRVESDPFRVGVSRSMGLAASRAGSTFSVTLSYPRPVVNQDLTFRPQGPEGGTVTFDVSGKQIVVKRKRGSTFSVNAAPGTPVTVAAGAARDGLGNLNATPLAAGAAQNAGRAANRAAVKASYRAHPPAQQEATMHGH